MCGIAGFHGPYGRADLTFMTDAIAHRGPDDAGIEVVPGVGSGTVVGLGHRRLSIIDLAGGHQPMWSGDGRAAIVFNGEIYNFREVRCRIEAAGVRLRTSSDTEAIIEGWRLWGEGIVDALDGMFAFGIWDEDRRSWFLARDRFGIKPLFYCLPSRGCIAFASEIKPLLPFVGGVKPHPEALCDYFLHGWVATEETIFAGVQRLQPGHVLLWEAADSKIRIRRYWRLEPGRTPVDEADCAEALSAALDSAVARHMVADVEVGLALSGGLDSSAVLASMVRAAPAMPMRSFSIGYGLPDDELPYAHQVARHLGVEHVERIVSADTFTENFARCVWHLEEPIAHPVMQTTFQVARLVRESVKVVLIGEGSDELFAGYPQYRLLAGPYRLLPRALRRDGFLAVGSLMPPGRTLHNLLVPGMFNRDLIEGVERRFDSYFSVPDIAMGASRFEIEIELPYNQLARIDKLTMAHSIEARVPFLDTAFAELAFGMPFDMKFRAGVHKHILRRAVKGCLPDEIVNRPKSGKGGTQALLPTILRMVTEGALAPLVSREAVAARGWFDPDAVGRYLGSSGRLDVRCNPIESRRRAKFALALAVIEQWARLFLDGQKP